MGRNLYVIPHPNGGWQVKVEGESSPRAHTRTQAEAIEMARKLAKLYGSELVIHGSDGRIREKDSHGRDPYPPKG